MAEIELRARARPCRDRDRRLADRTTRVREVAAWQAARTAAVTTIDWRFTTADARITLTHLYPSRDR